MVRTPRRWWVRAIAPMVAIAAVAALSGCNLKFARVGARCRYFNDVAQSRTHLLRCNGKRWVRYMTLDEADRMLAAFLRSKLPTTTTPRAPGTPITPATAPPTTIASIPAPGPFGITLRPLTPLTPEVSAAFDDAVARWTSIITKQIADAVALPGEAECPTGPVPISGLIRNLHIEVSVRPFTPDEDPTGDVLGRAGVCAVTNSDRMPKVGYMEFDSTDVEMLLAADAFDAVVLHEMAHVLGFGTLWEDRAVLGGTPEDPRFTGARAVAEYAKLGGTGTVPVEATGGEGTAGSHWRDSIFGEELMTGFIESDVAPMSAMTIASFGDLGYQVDLTKADPYTIPTEPVLPPLRRTPIGRVVHSGPTATLPSG